MGNDLQLSLFDDENVLRNQYVEALREFDLGAAAGALQRLAAAAGRIPEAPQKSRCLLAMEARAGQAPGDDPLARAGALLGLPDDPAFAAMGDDLPHLRAGAFRRVADALRVEASAYIPSSLHPAEVFLEVGRLSDAYRCAERSIARYGEDALLRQVMAWVCYARHDAELATIHAAHALFDDPLRCKEERLAPHDVRHLLERLKALRQDARAAWVELPFVLWKRNLLPVPADRQFYQHLTTRLENAPLPAAAHTARLSFVRALACAEIVRASGDDVDRMVALRARMQDLDADWFAEYMGVLQDRQARQGK